MRQVQAPADPCQRDRIKTCTSIHLLRRVEEEAVANWSKRDFQLILLLLTAMDDNSRLADILTHISVIVVVPG